MSDLKMALDAVAAVAAVSPPHPSQVVLKFPKVPGPIYDDVLIALQRLAEQIEGQEEKAVINWLRERGYKVEKL